VIELLNRFAGGHAGLAGRASIGARTRCRHKQNPVVSKVLRNGVSNGGHSDLSQRDAEPDRNTGGLAGRSAPQTHLVNDRLCRMLMPALLWRSPASLSGRPLRSPLAGHSPRSQPTPVDPRRSLCRDYAPGHLGDRPARTGGLRLTVSIRRTSEVPETADFPRRLPEADRPLVHISAEPGSLSISQALRFLEREVVNASRITAANPLARDDAAHCLRSKSDPTRRDLGLPFPEPLREHVSRKLPPTRSYAEA
jgi:hypothetical protein